ncbi:hypothetical protein ZBT109_2410 [Zymobacter palmae]|uniref:Uncharacterized protein n=1 Tax=Zymobacter palmae TaxID=33074 RepID=A0A348HHN9_9GAMM|nr:hypothetical protein ZBT109_2410 [Zymobacter palmae]
MVDLMQWVDPHGTDAEAACTGQAAEAGSDVD